jgi:hypothetical protein
MPILALFSYTLLRLSIKPILLKGACRILLCFISLAIVYDKSFNNLKIIQSFAKIYYTNKFLNKARNTQKQLYSH